MTATHPASRPAKRKFLSDDTWTLLLRLWHGQIRHHKMHVVITAALPIITALLTALYPLVIQRALDMFSSRDSRILYQVPLLVVMLTAAKSLAQYGQTVVTQGLVLKVVRGLQGEMFDHMIRSDITQVESEAPAKQAARFTTDAVAVRDAMLRAVSSVAMR